MTSRYLICHYSLFTSRPWRVHTRVSSGFKERGNSRTLWFNGGCGGWIRTNDLEVMGLTSCQTALLRAGVVSLRYQRTTHEHFASQVGGHRSATNGRYISALLSRCRVLPKDWTFGPAFFGGNYRMLHIQHLLYSYHQPPLHWEAE